MDEGRKIQALPLTEVRERLLSKRHDAFTTTQRVSIPSPAPLASPPAPKRAPKPDPPKEERTCLYSKCRKKFIPSRPDQVYHTADCRKRAWFDRNFVPIAKPEQ